MITPPSHRRGPRWQLAATVVFAVVLVASCSSGKSKKASTTSTTPSANGGASPSAAQVAPGEAPAEGAPDATPANVDKQLRAADAWGWNGYAQIGDGTVCDKPNQGDNCIRLAPVGVVAPGGSGPLSGLRSLTAGSLHNLALRPDRTVLSWGRNLEGELGQGGFGAAVPVPKAVVGPGGQGQLRNVTALGAGGAQSLAVSNGQVFAWGDNIWGELGVGTSDGPQHCPHTAPGAPSLGPTTTTRPAGAADSCAQAPTAVLGPTGTGPLTGVAALSPGDTHSVALMNDGTVWTWGLNDLGQLGIGNHDGPDKCKPFQTFDAVGCSTKPVQVLGPNGQGHLDNVKAIAAGADFTVALRGDGTVWAWGSGGFADLGQPNPSDLEKCITPFNPSGICSTKPLQVVGPNGQGFLTGVKSISTSGSGSGLHVLALKTDGSVWGWGVDDEGQLGNGQSIQFVPTPVQVVGPGGAGTLSGVAAIAAGGKYSMALKSDGTLWSWGYNRFGELGVNSATGPQQCTTTHDPCSMTPVQVAGMNGNGQLTGVAAVAAGDFSALVATES